MLDGGSLPGLGLGTESTITALPVQLPPIARPRIPGPEAGRTGGPVMETGPLCNRVDLIVVPYNVFAVVMRRLPGNRHRQRKGVPRPIK